MSIFIQKLQGREERNELSVPQQQLRVVIIISHELDTQCACRQRV